MSQLKMVKDFRVSNRHYRGLSDEWTVDVTYTTGEHSTYRGTMTEVHAYMLRMMIQTGQPAVAIGPLADF